MPHAKPQPEPAPAQAENLADLDKIIEASEDYKPLISEALKSPNASPEAMKALFDLQVAAEERAAQAALRVALSKFQGECPPIYRNRKGVAGGGFSYGYADLEQIVEQTRPILRKHGLTISWDSEVIPREKHPDEPSVIVTCSVTHINGARIESHFQTVVERKRNKSGQPTRSPAQDMQAAITTAQRHSMCHALALVASDDPSVQDRGKSDPIDAEQAAELEDLINQSGTDREKFLAWANVDSIEDIEKSRFRIVKLNLERKIQVEAPPAEPEETRAPSTSAASQVAAAYRETDYPLPPDAVVEAIARAYLNSGLDDVAKLRRKIKRFEGDVDKLIKNLEG